MTYSIVPAGLSFRAVARKIGRSLDTFLIVGNAEAGILEAAASIIRRTTFES